MRTMKIGILSREQYQKRMIAIASGQIKRKSNAPKVWFHSMKSLARVLSDKNVDLLKIITSKQPESISKLSEITGRNRSDLTRSLETMAQYGIVEFKDVDKKTKKPIVKVTEFHIHYPIV